MGAWLKILEATRGVSLGTTSHKTRPPVELAKAQTPAKTGDTNDILVHLWNQPKTLKFT